MREIPTKRRLIIAGLCAVLFLGLSFYYTTYPLGGEKGKSNIHLSALESYKKKANKEALAKIEKDYDSILEEKEGCELVISIFATNQQIGPTREASEKCIKLGKAVGISHEAYAMAQASVGESKKAIELLLEESKKHQDARIHAAIAQLYVFESEKENAHTHLLKAIEIGNPWSPWLSRVFTSKTFTEEKVFLRNLVPLLDKKQDVVIDAELKILSLLEKKGLTFEAEILKKRLKKVSGKSDDIHK